MRTRWSLHPEIEAGLGSLPPLPFEAAEIGADAIPAIREAMSRPAVIPDHMRHHEVVVDRGPALPALRLHVYAPDRLPEQARAGLLWIHGGGYIVGSAKDEARRVAPWVRAGYVVVAPDYRLAPEHPFPAGLRDCLDGLNETLLRSAELGIKPGRIVVGGGSAGGGLAAALAVRCRDLGIGAIRHLVLIAPMVDDRTVPPAGVRLAVWAGAANRLGWDSYLPDGTSAELPESYAAVARVADFSGLPPTTIVVGAADMFCVESVELASSLLRSGVPVDLHVYAGLPHGFDSLVPDSLPARVLERDLAESLERAASFQDVP
jgi:acetyl esterase/lipase